MTDHNAVHGQRMPCLRLTSFVFLFLIVVAASSNLATAQEITQDRTAFISNMRGGALVVAKDDTTVALWAQNWSQVPPHEGRIFCSYSVDQGLTWSTPKVIAHTWGLWASGGATDFAYRAGDAVVDENGTVHVIVIWGIFGTDPWQEVTYGQLDIANGILTNQRIFAEQAVTPDRYGYIEVSICTGMDAAGVEYVHAVYGEDTQYGANSAAYWYVRSSDGGTTWSTPVDIKGYSGCDTAEPCDLTADHNGNVYFFYGPEWDGYPRLHYCRSANSGGSWTYTALNTPNQSGGPTAMCDDTNGLFLFYNTNLGYVAYQWSTNNGTTWSPVMQVGPRYDPSHVGFPRIHVGWKSDCMVGFHIVYSDYAAEDNPDFEIFYVQMDWNGTILIPRTLQSIIGAPCNNWDFARSLVVYDEETFLVGCCQRFVWDWAVENPAFGEPYAMLVCDPRLAGTGENPNQTAPLCVPTMWPNPSWGGTSLQYQLDRQKPVQVDVCDISGRLVRTLVEDVQERGSHVISWDARNEAGEEVAQGIYLMRLRVGEVVSTKKIVVTR